MSRNLALTSLVVVLVVQSGGSGVAQPLEALAVLTPADTPNGGDFFGRSVAIDGAYVAVGAPADNHSPELPDSGAVYVFTGSGPNWTQQAKLKADTPRWSGRLGTSIALEGEWLVAGEPVEPLFSSDPGRAVIFRRSGETWTQHTELIPSVSEDQDRFGYEVAIDGDTIVVCAPDLGAQGTGAAFIFRWDGAAWIEDEKITDPDAPAWAAFGVGVSIDGTALAIGEAGGDANGAALVFRLVNSSWDFEAKLTAFDGDPFDHFGTDVSVRGDLLLVGSPGDDDFGLSSGAAYMFRRVDGAWVEEAKLTASDADFGDEFGSTVELADPLAYIAAVSAKSEAEIKSGYVYTLQTLNQEWVELGNTTPSPTERLRFGWSMDHDGDRLIVGATLGRAYLYATPRPIPASTGWTLLALALFVLAIGSYRLRRARILTTFVSMVAMINPVLAFEPNLSAPHHPNHLLVRFTESATQQGEADADAAAGATVIHAYQRVSNLKLVLVANGDLATALDAYAQSPEVLYAEPDYFLDEEAIPNDDRFPHLWNLHDAPGGIYAVTAWDLFTSGGLWTGDSDFRIAIIDSGIDYEHEDLLANMWTNPGEIPNNGIDDDANGYIDDVHGYDFGDRDEDPYDDLGHGTHVAGIVGAVGNNEIGVTGVLWNCKLVALKIRDTDGLWSSSAAVEAIEYALDNGITISNSSWITGEGCSTALRDAIAEAEAAGHIFVAAAGNYGLNNDERPMCPASYDLPNIISVAATDSDECRAIFPNGQSSSWGRTSVDLGAPGKWVKSTVPDDHYEPQNGTSMSAPHVTGVVALVWMRYPTWTYQQVIDRVFATVRPIPALDTLTAR